MELRFTATIVNKDAILTTLPSLDGIMAFATPAPVGAVSRNVRGVKTTCPRMGPWKPGEKDEAFEQQQAILARRRDKRKNKEYFDNVRRTRAEREATLAEKRLVVRDGEDPLIPWKELKRKGLIDEAGYGEDEQTGGIIIPMASFGIPKYDNGGRFDLKLPHVEIGYTDEDADVMGKAKKALGKFFGFGKTENKTKVETKTDGKTEVNSENKFKTEVETNTKVNTEVVTNSDAVVQVKTDTQKVDVKAEVKQ